MGKSWREKSYDEYNQEYDTFSRKSKSRTQPKAKREKSVMQRLREVDPDEYNDYEQDRG